MIRYFMVKEMSKKDFDRAQAEVGTNVSMDEDNEMGVISTWSHGQNIEGMRVAMVILDDFSCYEIPSLDLEEFETQKAEQEQEEE